MSEHLDLHSELSKGLLIHTVNFCIAGIDLGVASGIAPFGRPISNVKYMAPAIFWGFLEYLGPPWLAML